MTRAHESAGTPSPAVLIVEDDPYLRTNLQQLLRDEGFRVVGAADGLEGLRRLRTDNVAVVVLDLTMPRMDGPTFLEVKARNPEIARVPTVVVTGRDVVEIDIKRSVDAVLHKPVEFARLVAALRRLARKEDSPPRDVS